MCIGFNSTFSAECSFGDYGEKKKDTGLVPKQKAVVQSYTYLVQFGFSLTVSKGF